MTKSDTTKPSRRELLDWLAELNPETATGHTAAYNSFIIYHIKLLLEIA